MSNIRPKIVVLCGSSRFVDVMAVCAWLIERDENAIAMGLHLLPAWYPNVPADHLAEHEGVQPQMDELHLRKIDLADETFVVNCGGYIGSSTTNEVTYAAEHNKPVRWYTHDRLGRKVEAMVHAAIEQERAVPGTFDFVAHWNRLAIHVYETAKAKGWWDSERNDGELIALMHSELSEALEALRHGNPPDNHIPGFKGTEAEYADAVIRIMDHAHARGWRIAEAVVAKAAFNANRPHKHGGKNF